MAKIVTATQARKDLFKLLEQAGVYGATITITHQDKPPVIMMSAEEFEGWMETMEIMADPQLMKDIKEAEEEIKRGEVYSWEEVKEELDL